MRISIKLKSVQTKQLQGHLLAARPFLGTTDLLGTVLPLLPLLPGGALLGSKTKSCQAVLGIEFLRGIDRVVDQAETSGLPTTEDSIESENDHSVNVLDLFVQIVLSQLSNKSAALLELSIL